MQIKTSLTVGVVVSLALLSLHCGTSNYSLPPPKPDENAGAETSTSTPEASARESKTSQTRSKAFVEVKERVLELHKLLRQRRYREAVSYLSQETRNFLKMGKRGRSVEDALAEGRIILPNGQTHDFGSPLSFLLVEQISLIQDTHPDVSENETAERKEVFLTSGRGQTKKVVFIRAGGQWVLHKTSAE